MSPVVPKKQIPVPSPSASRPSFEAVPEISFEMLGGKEDAVIGAMPQYFTGFIDKNLIEQVFNDFEFVTICSMNLVAVAVFVLKQHE